jgi:hypothetical protein
MNSPRLIAMNGNAFNSAILFSGCDAAQSGILELLANSQHTAARLLQCSWRAHLVRALLWRRKKVSMTCFCSFRIIFYGQISLLAEFWAELSTFSYSALQIRHFQRECRGQTALAALWRGFRTKNYGTHAKALRIRRVRAGLPEEPPPCGSNRMVKRDEAVLKKWAEKEARARRDQLPSHEMLLQEYARKRAWTEQRSDGKPAAVVHWTTRALLKTVLSHDEMRPDFMRSAAATASTMKPKTFVGEFALQWLGNVGAWKWAQSRIVLLLQTSYR